MQSLKTYWITFSGLSQGVHLFDYQIDDSFFENFEHSLVQKGQLSAKIAFEKQESWMALDVEVQGSVVVPCDICAEDFDLPIDGKEHLLIKFGVAEAHDEAEVIYLEHGATGLQIAQYIYERILLSIPMKKVHPIDDEGGLTCDPEVLQYLIEEEDLEKEEAPANNALWAELQKLKK